MENYFTTQRDNVFRNVEVLIYVFDVESREVEKDMHYYQSCLEAILQVAVFFTGVYFCMKLWVLRLLHMRTYTYVRI